MRVAAVTMVWNEAHFLPLWFRHYVKNVGQENCFIIDHGSTDGSTTQRFFPSCITLPRSPLDEVKRCSVVSSICEGLLNYYDCVIYADVDELLVPDPIIASTLREFAEVCTTPIVTAVGLNVIHAPDSEPDINPDLLVSHQRSSVWFAASMCKPLMIKSAVRWQPGFHSSDAAVKFEPLFNFHLRRYDLNQGLERLQKTRNMQRAFPGLNSHQAIPDEQWRNDFKFGVNAEPRRGDVSLLLGEEPLSSWISKIENEQYARSSEFYKLDIDLLEKQRWKIPERFIGLF